MPKGSHSTYGGWESKVCAHCGKKLVLSRGVAAYHFNPGGKPWSTCGDCITKGTP